MENNDLFELADGGKILVRCKAERVRDCAVPAGVETIAPEAFADRAFGGGISLPSSLREIGDRAFAKSRFDGFGEVAFPDGLERIGNGAFGNNCGLDRVRIPTSLRELGDSAFARSEIYKIEWGGWPDLVGSGVFLGCRYLRRAILPAGATHVPPSIFAKCRALVAATVVPAALLAVIVASGRARSPSAPPASAVVSPAESVEAVARAGGRASVRNVRAVVHQSGYVRHWAALPAVRLVA